MPISHTDYLLQGSPLNVVPGLWVRLLNNSTGTNYFSTAVSDATGAFTHSAPPGDYKLFTGLAATVPGTPTLADAHYPVPVTAGDDIVGTSYTGVTSGPYASSAPAGSWVTAVDPYNVRAYGAKLDGVTDDSNAWYSGTGTGVLEKIPSAGGQVAFPPGVSIITKPILPKTNTTGGTVILGAGRGLSILKAGTGTFGSGTLNRGLIDYTSGIYTGDTVRDVQFDITAPTYGSYNIGCVHQNNSQMRHVEFSNLWCEMPVNAFSIGVQLEGTSSVIGGTSFDIRIQNIYGHNGDGTVNVFGNAADATALTWGLFIENIVNLVDINGIADDRVAVASNTGVGVTGNPDFRDVTIRAIYVTVTSAVSSTRVNGVKLDTGTNGNAYLHNISIRDVFFRYYGTGLTAASPIIFLISGANFLQDVFVDNVWGINCKAIVLRMARFESNPVMTITNVHMKGCVDTISLEIYVASAAFGDELMTIRQVSLHTTRAISGNTPTAILLTSGAGAQGANGMVVIDTVMLQGYSIGIANNLNEALGAQATAWAKISITNLGTKTVTTPLSLANGTAKFMSASDDNYFGAGAPGSVGSVQTGNYLDIGSLGDPDLWVDSRSDTNANVSLSLRALGTGVVKSRSTFSQIKDFLKSKQSPAFAASPAPDPTLGEIFAMAALTGNVTVANPINAAQGQRLLFIWTQDGTGTRTVTYSGTNWRSVGIAAQSTAASTVTIDEAVCVDGTIWRVNRLVTGQTI